MPLNPVARSAINELRRVFHVTDLTPDEIVELNDLGAAQMAAGKSSDGERICAPVRVGNVTLHPLTCAAEDWLEYWEDKRLSRKAEGVLIPFAMAHGREPDLLWGILTGRDAERELRAFRRKAGATEAELDDACTDLLRGDEDIVAPSIRVSALAVCDWIGAWDKDLAQLLRQLCLTRLEEEKERAEAETPRVASRWRRFSAELGAMTGVSPDYWYSADRSLALVAYRRAIEQEAFRAGLGAKGFEKSGVITALAAQRKAVKRIVDLRKTAYSAQEGGSCAPAGQVHSEAAAPAKNEPLAQAGAGGGSNG